MPSWYVATQKKMPIGQILTVVYCGGDFEGDMQLQCTMVVRKRCYILIGASRIGYLLDKVLHLTSGQLEEGLPSFYTFFKMVDLSHLLMQRTMIVTDRNLD